MSYTEEMVAEWDYLFDVAKVENGSASLSISPNEDERTRIARRLSVVSLDVLTVDLKVIPIGGAASVRVEGVLKADVTQNCVVTGDTISAHVEEEFEGFFSDSDAAVSLAKVRREKEIEKGKTELPILEEADDPDPIVEGQINLGELVVQHLSLAVDPYPKAEGVRFENTDDELGGGFSFKNPFAALKEWKEKQTQGNE